MSHPNATAGAVMTALATLAIWLSDRLFHYELSQVYGAAIAGAIITGVLFIGDRGLKGTLQAVWHGGGAAWHGTEPAKK